MPRYPSSPVPPHGFARIAGYPPSAAVHVSRLCAPSQLIIDINVCNGLVDYFGAVWPPSA